MKPTMRNHIGEEEQLQKEIIELQNFVNRTRETNRCVSREVVDAETLLKRKKQRLNKIISLRNNFKFETDLPESEANNPLDILIRDKYKDENYKGYIDKERATDKINEMNMKECIGEEEIEEDDYIFIWGGNAETE